MTELLVVIALVMLLAALAWPALRSISEKGSLAQRLGSLRLIGTAITQFAAEHEGYLPGPMWPGQIPVYSPARPGRLATDLAAYLGVDTSRGEHTVSALYPKAFQKALPRGVTEKELRVYVLNMAAKTPSGAPLNPWGSRAAGGGGPRPLALVQNRAPDAWAVSEADRQLQAVASAAWAAQTIPRPLSGGRHALYFDGSVRRME